MKNRKIFFCVTLVTLCFVRPLTADKIRHQADPLDESAIVNSLEMDSDTDQNTDENITGEIIFDNSFAEPEKKTEREIRSSRKNGQILNKLRAEDRRWHFIEYRVKANDSIWGIAKKFGTDTSTITDLNDIERPGQIRKGQIILVPSKKGIYYTIKKGDTLTSISKKYQSEISEIAVLNNIDGSDIMAGRKIFIPGAVEQSETVSKKIIIRGKDDTRVADLKNRKEKNVHVEKKVTGVVLTWPLRGPVTSGFGYRKDPFSGSRRFHCGMDIGAEIGTPVKAAGNGKVIFSGWKGSYGYLVVISHEKNYISVYAHNSKNLVKTGETIKKGEVVALSGNTGAVTGAHLHFEIRKGTIPLNPRRLLKK